MTTNISDLNKAIIKNSIEVVNVASRLFEISEAFNTLNMTGQADEYFNLASKLLKDSRTLNKNFTEYLKDSFK